MAKLTDFGKALTASQMAQTTTTPPIWVGIGSGGTGADPVASTATALVTPYTTASQGVRVTSNPVVTTVQTTVAGDTVQVVGLLTAATAGVVVNEAGLFTALTGTNMAVVAGFGAITLAVGDSISITGKIQYT